MTVSADNATNSNDALFMRTEDLVNNFLSGQKNKSSDAGRQAREKIQARSKSIGATLLRTYLLISGLFFAVVGGAAWYLYTQVKMPGVMVTDTRPCEFVDEGRGIHLTGRRHYSYMERELFGIQYKDSSKVREETELDVNGTSMNVVGLNSDSWWGVFIGQGEKGIQLLKPASVFVFTIGPKNVVVNDRDFCK